jgi:acetyl esterase/lipase
MDEQVGALDQARRDPYKRRASPLPQGPLMPLPARFLLSFLRSFLRSGVTALGLLTLGCVHAAHAAPSSAAVAPAAVAPAAGAPSTGAPSAVDPAATEVALWPGVAPGSQGLALKESITERSKDPQLPDRFVAGVTRPRLLLFRAPKPNGTGVILAPGGGYVRTVLDKEGFETARWLAARGVSTFVLLYRLPGEGHAQRADVPLQDAQRAVRLVRGRAREFGLDARRIGFLGFSAGGHVAASVATRFDAQVYTAVDALDAVSARPDFSILLYPVISMDPSIAHAGSRQQLLGEAPSAAAVASYSLDNVITAATPATLLILTDDDTVVLPENGLRYYSALHRHGVPAELHVFARGKHGFGIRGAKDMPVGNWPELAWTWLAASGFVPTPAPVPAR